MRGLAEGARDAATMRMMVELAHALGMEVVAEGVEDETRAARLRQMDCDLARGYFASEPPAADDVPGFLAG